MDIEHPTITKTIRTGYPYSDKRQEYGVDGLRNEVFTGEQILKINDEFFLVDELTEQSIELLELLGAVYENAR